MNAVGDGTDCAGSRDADSQDGEVGRDPPAQARLAMLADEQAALRRVATLVARETAPEEVFAAVAGEVGQLLEVDFAILVRYDPQDTLEVVGAWTRTGAPAPTPVGGRLPLGGRNVTTMVHRAGRPSRIDYGDVSGVIGQVASRDWGLRSSIGVPVSAESRLWGCIVVAFGGQQPRPLPTDTEARLASFTELVATAIANTESRGSLAQLAREQAALRRVATLVARGVPPVEIFAAVSDEVTRLFGSQAGVVRFDHEGPAVVFVGISKAIDLPVGTRWEFQPGMASAEVYRTGCSARVDARDWSSASGPVAGAARRLGIVSNVGSPIVVEGHLWGAMIVVSTDELLPLGLEGRLEKFTELLAAAIANAESRSELAASRRRIVAASDQARRRIERDLHDGTQQRLVSLGLAARAAAASVPADRGDLRAELSRIAAGLADAVAELQEFSRGIHPAIISTRGLGPALRTLARRSPVPVDLDVTTEARFLEPIEIAAYYVASEALANAMKHAQASRIELSLATRQDSLLLSIRDDGIGGADAARGSGLAGLTDRVEALGGSIDLRSAAGAGTVITVDLPLEYEVAEGAGLRARGLIRDRRSLRVLRRVRCPQRVADGRPGGRDARIAGPPRARPQRRDGVDLGRHRVRGLLVGDPPADKVRPGRLRGALDREVHLAQPFDCVQEFPVAEGDLASGDRLLGHREAHRPGYLSEADKPAPQAQPGRNGGGRPG
jgi:signal transduction histidine kinase